MGGTETGMSGGSLVAALEEIQKSQANLAFDSPERFNWHRIPRERLGWSWTGTR
jgi:hypothetical protein